MHPDSAAWAAPARGAYGMRSRRTQIPLGKPTQASARDHRRPLMAKSQDWPQASEGMYNLPSYEPKSVATTVNGTLRLQESGVDNSWKALAATPLWQRREDRPVLQTFGYVVQQPGDAVTPWMEPCDSPLRQSARAWATQERAAAERSRATTSAFSSPRDSRQLESAPYRELYTSFMSHRPETQRALFLDALRNERAARRVEADDFIKSQTRMINERSRFLTEIGISPRRERKAAAAPSPAPAVFSLRGHMEVQFAVRGR